MTANTAPSRSRRRKTEGGYTLVELLVVITIIGILVAILLPVIFGVIRSGQRKQAAAEITGLDSALRAYYSDVGHYPADTGEPGQAVTANLVSVLSGQDVAGQNPHRKLYLQFKSTSLDAGVFVDPWGKPYWISTDTNLDGQNGPRKLPAPVLVWSGGPDEDPFPPNDKDNLASW